MIQINCTNCKSLLQIDDAFAGGVCRCRHCGTIQTVPKRLKASSASGDSTAAATEGQSNGQRSPKTLYQQKKTAVIDSMGSGTGLDDLAGIVASSGLTSSRLQKKPAPPAPPAAAGPKTGLQDKRIVIIVSSAAGVIALLLGIIIAMAIRDRAGVAGDPQVATGGSTGAVTPNSGGQAVVIPTFLGQPTVESAITYVLDRGSASEGQNRLEFAKTALVKALKSLGPDRTFQVVLWGVNNDAPEAWPADGMRTATADNIAQLQTFLDGIYPSGATYAEAALAKAFKANPQAVVLVPMKNIPGDQAAFARSVLRTRADARSTAKFYCFSIANDEWGPGLQRIADATGGAYKPLTMDELRAFAE